jgi:regulator of protease activity HflC (stomatin/prohibitin superfamily)
MGEVVKVDVGNTGLNLDESFWPRLTDEQKRLSMEQLALQGKASLKPGEDGSLLTGDQNIAHARWSVIYTRKSPRNYSENVLSEDEKRIVQGAVERGIVQAVAQVKIDDLLKQSASDEGSVATRAKEIAQSTLNAINSGISIDQLTLKEKAPPFSVYNDFSRVQSAQQAASGKREEANSTARNTLNAMSGSAHAPLIAKIDEYEQALARNDAAAKDTLLAEIFGILDGKAVGGEKGVPAGAVSGQVTYLLNNAKQYRSSIVSQRQGELASFKAKLAQFKTNPDVVVQREWADAMTAFLARPMVEIFNLPPGSRVVELWLNRDPDFLKEYQEAAKRKKVEDAEERRRLEQMREIFRTRTDAVEVQTR